MKKDCLYIDTTDAWVKYGMFVEHGGYNDLLRMPSMKKVVSNVWAEYEGAEVDLYNYSAEAKDITIQFVFKSETGYRAFVSFMANTTYHTFNFKEVGRTFSLRYVSASASYHGGIVKASVKLYDDAPTSSLSTGTKTEVFQKSDYEIDGMLLSKVGVKVLAGTYESFLPSSDVSKGFEMSLDGEDGLRYGGNACFKAHTARINCLMRANSLEGLWANYDALFKQMTGKVSHTIKYVPASRQHHFYYNSCNVQEFQATNKPWIKFSLTITLTDNLK